jgi:hypothetical protein
VGEANGVPRHQAQVGTFGGERLCGGQAYAFGAAGDERATAGQTEIHECLFCGVSA